MASVFLFSPDTNNTMGKLIIVQIKSNFLTLTRDKQHVIIDKSETLEPKVEACHQVHGCTGFLTTLPLRVITGLLDGFGVVT